MGGEADDGVGAEDVPGHCGRGVVLPDVHPVSPDGQRQVGTVVEYEGDTGGLADLADNGGPFQQGTGLEVLLAQLHQVDAPRDGCGHEVGQVGPVRRAEVEVAVREVEAGAHADARALAFIAFLVARTLTMLSASVMSATER